MFSFGKIESLVPEEDNPIAAKYWFAPFTTPLGIVPQANWDWLNQDPDGDGLPTIDELFAFDTNPRNPDTDCDGLSDRDELLICGTALRPCASPRENNHGNNVVNNQVRGKSRSFWRFDNPRYGNPWNLG